MIVALALLLAQPAPVDGVWTNEEQVAFEREAGREPPQWIGVLITTDADGHQNWQRIDRTSAPISGTTEPTMRMMQGNASLDGDTLVLSPSGGALILHHANPFTCWVSVPKADGEWLFEGDVRLFDGGARATVGGGDTGTEAVTIHLRNVVWPPPSTNRPSLVLYAYRADDSARAAGYVWGEPDATRLGLNLRWMQASCTKDTP